MLELTLKDPDPFLRAALAGRLGAILPHIKINALHHEEPPIIMEILLSAGGPPQIRHFEKPVRLGRILDWIAHVQTASPAGDPVTTPLQIGKHSLDPDMLVLTKENGETVRLTEKETYLLRFLSEAPGKSASREDLLKAVWGYGQNIETHTLETHIYRLRQKIEDDTAAPSILLTDGSGYRLAD